MNTPAKSIIFALTSAALLAHASAATFVTVGVYDENTTESNTVDTDIGGTLGSFTTDVATAFGNNRGGVIDFQTGFTNSGNNSLITSNFDADYAGGAKTLAFSSTDVIEIWHNNTAGQVDTISDNNNLLPTNNVDDFTLTIGAISGGALNEVVSEIGLTVLSRSAWVNSPAVNITANYSGGGSTLLSSSISGVIGADDTFYHFVAPAGESITSLYLDNQTGGGNPNQNRIPVDDLAFITTIIPEPSSFLLIVLSATFGLIRRRR